MGYKDNLLVTGHMKIEIKSRISLTIVAALVVVANVVIIVYLIRKRRNPFEDLLLSLAASDFAVGLITVLVNALSMTLDDIVIIQTIGFCFISFSVDSSMLHVVVITIDRFLAVKFPLSHRIKRKRKSTLYAVFFATWVLPIAITALKPFIPLSAAFQVTGYVLIAVNFIILSLYCLIIKTALSQSLPVRCNSKSTRTNSRKKQLILVFSSFGIFLAFFISMFPSMLCVSKTCNKPVKWLFLLLNSLLDPLAYFSTTLIEYCLACGRKIKPRINTINLKTTRRHSTSK